MLKDGNWAKSLHGICAFAAAALLSAACARGVIITNVVTDGFGDGDRDNNGLDTGAAVTNASDVGVPWLLTDGTSAVTFRAIDDTGGINTGNALQLNNTSSNNRPSVGHFPAVTLADGDAIRLRFDMRLVSVSTTTSDRNIRFGIYRDVNGDDGTVDHSSTGSVAIEDVGYNARIDAGNDVSNSTSMDVTRDAEAVNIIQATTTGISVSSTNANDQLLIDGVGHHMEMILTRSGTGMVVSLQKDSNAVISNTDAAPPSFVFDEVALGVRSAAAFDVRFDNITVDYIAAPEPTAFTLLTLGAAGSTLRRRSRR